MDYSHIQKATLYATGCPQCFKFPIKKKIQPHLSSKASCATFIFF